jgi:hypothetical protein
VIAWLLSSWMGQLAFAVFAIWFARGVWKATMRPRLTYVSHSEVKGHGWFITVRRQELIPPWRTIEETWLTDSLSVSNSTLTRVGDGKVLYDFGPLSRSLLQLIVVARARDAETEQILKPEARPN